jgi:hypothetical protein
VLGAERRGNGTSRRSGGQPQPLMMAPRRRMPRVDTGMFSLPVQMTAGVALPHPHIGRPALRRPHVPLPTLKRPHFSRAAASTHLDRLIRSRLWIAVLGVMLVSIVAMRVEVLKLGTKTGTAVQTASQLQAKNAIDQADVARLENPSRISRLAGKWGMVPPDPTDTKFLSRGSGANLNAAIHGIKAPNAAQFETNLANSESASGDTSASTADTAPTDG